MKKSIIFGVIGFVLAVVTGGHAFAKTGDIPMGTIAIPLPGCAPEVTIGDKDTSTGCYTMTVQNKTLQNGVCSSSGINPTTKQVCDGKNGVGGNCESKVDVTSPDSNGCYTVTYQGMKVEDDECVEDGDPLTYTTCDGATEVEDERYIPYPLSETYEHQQGLINTDEPGHEGYRRLQLKFKTEGNSHVLKFPDHCEEGEDEDGLRIRKCDAQGDAAPDSNWPNSEGTIYQAGDTYFISLEELESSNLEYTIPRLSGGTTGYPLDPGVLNRVYKYTSGRVRSEFVATDTCDWYAKQSNTNDRVRKCTVRASAGTPGAVSPYAPGVTYCLENHLSDCNQYTIPVGAVDACAGLTPSDAEWETTVNYSESDYTGPDYNTGCTTNCSGTSGFKTTKEVMCNGKVNVSTQPDRCSYASGGTVQCASGYAYQTCTPRMVAQDGTGTPYSGCFEDTLGGLYARRSEIVPVSLAADTNNLYYCKIADCDSDSTCWIGGNEANGPNPEATACWGTVSITGLTGDAGPGCSFIYNGTKWQTCCWPVTSGGAVDTAQSPTCTDVTGDLLNQLNNWMCKPTYTTKYINKKSDGTYEYKPTDTNNRTAATVGVRTTITNCDGTNGGDVDVFDGPAGDDYDPCDGLTAGSQAAQTTIQNQTKVYRSHNFSPNHYTPARGYYETTVTYCEGSTTTYTPADECTPVADARLARSVTGQSCADNQVLKRCTPQEGTQTPYFICDTTEVSGYPKKKYFVPTIEDGKITKEGYTAWVHKYTSGGNEVKGDLVAKDECHTVYKLTRTPSGNTVTATTQTTQKCTMQSYTYPTPSSPWTVGAAYCWNTDASGSCTGYSDSISDSETSTLKYHLPIMDGTTPTGAGYTYYEVKDGDNVTVREIRKDKDSCDLVYRKAGVATTYPETTWKCVVQTPGDTAASATYTTGHEYCLDIAAGACTNYQDTIPEPDMCNGSTSATAVKKVVSRTYTHTTGSQGALTSVYKMCNDDDHAETTPDECHEIIPTPAGQTCANGVWMQCTRQADENATATRGTTYGYCATYPQCVGNPSSSSIVKKTQRSYTAPTKTNSENSYYTTPGKVTDVKIACSGSTISTAESAEDQCEEIPDTNSICPTNKVLKTCKRKGDESSTLKAESTYNLCTAGTSIFSAISENDPCDGDTTSDAAKKKVKSIQYEYVAPVTGDQSKRVGYSVKTTTMCHITDGTNDTLTEYIYDTCEPLAASNSCKRGSTYKPYYKCNKQTYDASGANATNREYNACDPLPAAVALSSAVANKLDSDVEFKIKPNDQDGNKDYITITGSNMTDKPVVALESLQGASALELWKEQQTDNTTCLKLFSKNCNALGLTEFMQDISDYGTWAREELQDNPNASANDLSRSSYRATLQPCQGGFSITEDDTYSGADGKRYTMTCND